MRALLYGRVSHDPSGHGRSVDSQLDECRRWAASEGWHVVDEVRDVDRSASRHARRRREGWDGVTARLQAGGIDVLVTWEASRAQRDLEQYAELRRLCEQTGTRWAYSGTVYDLAERSDRFRTGLDALVAEDEAGRISERVRRGIAAAAANGRPHGRLLYGYRRMYDEASGSLVGQEPDGVQSEVVSEIMRRFLAGDSINGLAADLTNRGIPSPGRSRDGGPSVWRRSQLHRMLSNPAYAGFRTHQGRVVGKADWQGIVDSDDWHRVQARLADPERRAPRPTANGPGNLLTGIARCGVCGATLVAGQDRGRRQYVCRAAGFHVARDMNFVDAYVTAIVLERLARADTSLEDSPGDDVLAARREADEMRARLEAAADAYVAGNLSAATLSRVEAQLTTAISDAERRARYAGLPTTVAELIDGDAAWDDLSIAQRREVIRGLITVRVDRSARPRGSRGFDPKSVAVTFRR